MTQEKTEKAPIKLHIYDCDETLTTHPIASGLNIKNLLKEGVPLQHDSNNILAIATFNPEPYIVMHAVALLLNIEHEKIKLLECKHETGYCISKYKLPRSEYPMVIISLTFSINEIEPISFKKLLIGEIVRQYSRIPITEFSYTDHDENFLKAIKDDEVLGRKFNTIHVTKDKKFTIVTPTPEKKSEKLDEYNTLMLQFLIDQISNYRQGREKDTRKYKVPLPFFNNFGFGGLAGCSRDDKLSAARTVLKELHNIQSGHSVENTEDVKEACNDLRQGTDCNRIIKAWELGFCSVEEYLDDPTVLNDVRNKHK